MKRNSVTLALYSSRCVYIDSLSIKLYFYELFSLLLFISKNLINSIAFRYTIVVRFTAYPLFVNFKNNRKNKIRPLLKFQKKDFMDSQVVNSSASSSYIYVNTTNRLSSCYFLLVTFLKVCEFVDSCEWKFFFIQKSMKNLIYCHKTTAPKISMLTHYSSLTHHLVITRNNIETRKQASRKKPHQN